MLSISPKSILLSGFLSLSLLTSFGAQAQNYEVLEEFHQPAAPNVEKADITVIRCFGRKFYIYTYFRKSGPNARAILPPNWGTPLGGGDHSNFSWAVAAACASVK